MKISDSKYIILELIPTSSKKETGIIIQLSALKLDGFKLIDRFDYRVNDEKIDNKDLRELISYDKDNFIYVEDNILDYFTDWAKELPLLIINNDYTLDYLKDINNNKISVFSYLGLDYSNDVFEKIIKKYNLENSNYLVDLLYEAIIEESNNSDL